MDIVLCSSALGELQDCFSFLWSNRQRYWEATTSRVLALVAFGDVLDGLNWPGMPTFAEVRTVVSEWIEKCEERFHYIERNPSYSAYAFPDLLAFLCLTKLKAQGTFPVPGDLWCLSQNYVMDVAQSPVNVQSPWTMTIRAYAIYVLSMLPGTLSEDQSATVRQLAREALLESKKANDVDHSLSSEGLAWLLPTLVQFSEEGLEDADVKWILSELEARVDETPVSARFVPKYTESWWGYWYVCHSSRRTDGTILDVLCRLQPSLISLRNLIPKIVVSLLASRINGRWSNSLESVTILLALKRYYDTFEATEPDFSVEYEWGKELVESDQMIVGMTEFRGRSTESTTFHIPMTEVDGVKEMVLKKNGPGRLYWHIGLRSCPSDLRFDSMECGFFVKRSYEVLEGPDPVRHTDDGSWEFQLGSLIRSRIEILTESQRYHVLLVEHLPAGCESVDPSLPALSVSDSDEKSDLSWIHHRNFRDTCVEMLTTPRLLEGRYICCVFFRCTSVGEFVVHPTRVEQIYVPEVFGRTKSEVVRITSID